MTPEEITLLDTLVDADMLSCEQGGINCFVFTKSCNECKLNTACKSGEVYTYFVEKQPEEFI